METNAASRNFGNTLGATSATAQGHTSNAQEDINGLIANAHGLLEMLENKLHPILMNVPSPIEKTKEPSPVAVTPFHDSQLTQRRGLNELVDRLAQLSSRIDL